MSNEEMKRDKSKEEEHQNEGEAIIIIRPNPHDYARAVSKLAVTQICQGLGFESLKESSLEALSDVMLRFICDLGRSATFHANLAARSDSNLFDILEGFIELGFTSSGSEFVQYVSGFVNGVEETPFAHPIPRFPVVVMKKGGLGVVPSFSQMNENPGGKHIPDWLPAFPDPHTYVHLSLGSQRQLDLPIDNGEQARQRRKAEQSLLNLQQRLLSSGLAGPSGNDTEGKGEGIHNGVFEKKHLLVKETFAPAIDALKGGGNNDDNDSDGSNFMDVDNRVMSVPVPVKRRPVAHFNMKTGKKMLVEDLDIHLRGLYSEKRGSFVRDNDKDDKKRRAEFILRQSAIEYPQEVSQM